MSAEDSELVYSTDPERNKKCPKCKKLMPECGCGKEKAVKMSDYIAVLRIETGSRGGKVVTAAGITRADLGVAEVYVQRLVFNGLGLATDANALHGRLREREQALLAEAEALATRDGIAMRASGLTTPLASLQGDGDPARHWAG